MLKRRPALLLLQGGFSLVELAIGLLILALLLGALLQPLGQQIEQRKVHQTDAELEHIREALYGFAMAHGRLPRPARSEIDGHERDTCTDDSDCTGFVPWTTLGVPRADAWGKLYLYSVTRRFAVIDTTRPGFADAGAWTIQTRLTTAPGKLVDLAEHVVAVVRSFGARSFGRSIHGTDIANESKGNLDEIFNSGTGSGKGPRDTLTLRHRLPATGNDPAHGGAFDDQMVWISTSLYMRHMVGAGQLP